MALFKNAENIKLAERCSLLEQQNQKLEQQLEAKNSEIRKLSAEFSLLENDIAGRNSYKERKSSENEQKQAEEENWLKNFYDNLGEYYTKVDSIFYPDEQYVFYLLKRILDSRKYIIAPKIRVIDFIEPLPNNEKSPYHWHVVNEVIKKHVDFLICEHVDKGRDSDYKPVLVVEVFGKSHEIRDDVKRNDEFKKSLFEAYGIELLIIDEKIKKLEELEQKIKEKLLEKAVVS